MIIRFIPEVEVGLGVDREDTNSNTKETDNDPDEKPPPDPPETRPSSSSESSGAPQKRFSHSKRGCLGFYQENGEPVFKDEDNIIPSIVMLKELEELPDYFYDGENVYCCNWEPVEDYNYDCIPERKCQRALQLLSRQHGKC